MPIHWCHCLWLQRRFRFNELSQVINRFAEQIPHRWQTLWCDTTQVWSYASFSFYCFLEPPITIDWVNLRITSNREITNFTRFKMIQILRILFLLDPKLLVDLSCNFCESAQQMIEEKFKLCPETLNHIYDVYYSLSPIYHRENFTTSPPPLLHIRHFMFFL